MKAKVVFLGSLAALLCGGAAAQATDDVLITEFMAANKGPVVDEDGDTSDWIEIHNNGMNPVDLGGWYLSGKASNPTQWRFPSTNFAPNAYMIIFASGKNRRVPGAPLHTSFSLKASGDYLALVQPDGQTVASSFGPLFPPQVDGISYGIPIQQTVTTLISTGATARVLVPANDALGTAWTGAVFDDSSWASLKTGVGYEGAFVAQPLANSVGDFSGVQGQNNWYYGYWDRANDGDEIYSDTEFIPFPNGPGPYSASNFWDGATWNWFQGDPPWTQLTSTGGIPTAQDADPSRDVHWAIRRYISPVEGGLSISGQIGHTEGWGYMSASGVCYDSVIYIFLNGPGEGYIDDLKLVAGSVAGAGPNLLANGNFENASISPWTIASSLSGCGISTNAAHSGTRSLHLVFSSPGSQSSAIKQTISPSLSSGHTYTLSYWYLPKPNSSTLEVQNTYKTIDTTPGYCGDGIIARIFVDGTEFFEQTALNSSANYLASVPVHAGSRVDFAIDPGAGNNDACDSATFTAAIQTGPVPPGIIADSVADWSLSGTQGEKNWFYGYYDQTADTVVAGYQTGDFTPFPRGAGPHGANNFWDGASWKWWNGEPPFDLISDRPMNPNGSKSGHIHWVIRRWLSEVNGQVTVSWTFVEQTADGAGVTARVLLNGALKDSVTLPGASPTVVNRSITLPNVHVGDAIDFALDPLGSNGDTADTGDRALLTATISGSPSLSPLISANLESAMRYINASAYLRIPFVVTDPAAVRFLTLRMKYDDGFVAYLNGRPVASANAPLVLSWNSSSSASHSDAAANQYEDFNLTSALSLLEPGTNILAIQGLNLSVDDADFLVLPELLAIQTSLDPSNHVYFISPTPGAINGLGATNLGPFVLSASQTPPLPTDTDDLLVTARVSPTINPISSVRLIYRINYGSEVNVVMFDDGLHGDGAAGDGTYAGVIPASASGPGDMVRYYVYATDTRTNSSRYPSYFDPLNSPQYQGTVVINPALTNPLPVVHMFVQNPLLATNYSGTRCSIFFKGEFYDNVSVNLHGQTTADNFDKRSMNIGMNSGNSFLWNSRAKRVGAFDLITTAPDKAYMRQVLSYETFGAVGVPNLFAFPVRLQMNNALFGVMHVIENTDHDFLHRIGLDPNGAFYKIYLPLTNAYAGVAEKKTRKNEDNSDLQALIEGCASGGRNYLYDSVNIPEAINFLATMQVVQDEDCCDFKNYALYRDTDATGEWQFIPYDQDLTFGRVFTDWICLKSSGGHCINWTGGYYDTNIFWTNRWYTETRGSYDFIGVGNTLANALWAQPEIYNMFLRRWTTVQEQLLQTNNTHPLRLRFERRVDELSAQINPDAIPDLAKWGTFTPTQTLIQATTILKSNYFAPRRGWIFNTLRYANGGPYLGPQPTNAIINFGAIDYNPASGNQAQEYIQLNNTNIYEVDISGWRIAGGVNYTFRGGVVIPRFSSLFVSPDVAAFRSRGFGPHGGLGLFVQGNYLGQLSARGESLQLIDNTGRLVSATNYAGNPSLAQQYLRITEIMYHPPAPPPGLLTNAEEFEFIELKNTGPVALDLTGVRFINGIQFDFTASVVTNLPPGATVLVVHNLAAFVSRYGSGFNVAGAYSDFLDNNGENIRLIDASGEKILDFSYDDKWYPITGGAGFSLGVVDEQAPWDTWGLKSSWRASGALRGSPGQSDTAGPPQPPILLTEVITHTNLPALDQIELFNPTTNIVDINGWYLTDDFLTPAKYRIHDRPPMPPGSYAVFDENDFDAAPGAPGNFGLSSKGEQVCLFSADAGGNLSGYYHGFPFGAAESGVSFGRYVNSIGQELFVAQTAATPGSANAGPRTGPIVVSEIHYHPPDLADGSNDSLDEFIELQNVTASPIPLFDPSFPANRWHLGGAVDFDFPFNITLAPGGFLLLVTFDPANGYQLASFRAKYGVGAGVPIFGPCSGSLPNSSATITLSRPDAPSSGTVPYILVDQIDYSDSAPWPSAADGSGASLQRIAATQFGNDPANWTAATPTPGGFSAGNVLPSILGQPASQTVIASASPTLSVSAAGSGPFRYQWQFYGTNLWGATNATLLLSNVLAEDAGPYSVAVFNNGGAALSSNAIITVLYGAYFTRQPTNLSVSPGASAVFNAAVTSSSALHYQWQLNSTNVPGATNASLTVTNVQPLKSGFYQLIATDTTGPIASLPALLTVLGPPAITAQPQGATVPNGNAVTFNVTATGTQPLAYQWRFNATNLPSASSSAFTVPNAQLSAAGNYSVVVSNSVGSVTSAVATLTVLAPPSITGQPLSITVTNGSDASFLVIAFGTGPLSYQWRFNGTNISNAVSSPLTISNAQSSAAGNYSVVISNSIGSVTSAVATLTILVHPTITTQPLSLTVTNGTDATFSVTASGTPLLSYQWQFNGANLTNALAPALTIPNAQLPDAGGYSVIVSNSVGSITSVVATLTVLAPPMILAQPTNQFVRLSSNAVFLIVASGTDPLAYQWSFAPSGTNDSLLEAALSSVLVITNTYPTNAGNYYATITNAVGAITSAVVTLTLVDGDADGDGMPDLWELAHGLNPFANDASEDPDHDQMTNLQEYLSGTDPRDSTSYLKIDQLTAAPDAWLLTFLAGSNRTYTILYRNSADTDDWLKLVDTPAQPTNRLEVIRDANPDPASRFYRLVTPALR